MLHLHVTVLEVSSITGKLNSLFNVTRLNNPVKLLNMCLYQPIQQRAT